MRINDGTKFLATQKIPGSDAELRYEIFKKRKRKVLASVLNEAKIPIPENDAVVWENNNEKRKPLQAYEEQAKRANNNYKTDKHPESDAVVYINNKRQGPVR